MDAVELQVITGALRAACEEMGATLIRAAHSANIKERRDCSTALFDPQGQMVMQAEHIPVHLGAMPAAVGAVRDRTTPRAGRGSSTTRSRAAPTCPTSPSSRRCSPTPAAARCSASRPAAPTTPTSARACRARCPRTRPRSTRRAS
jgi:hypothetical protein